MRSDYYLMACFDQLLYKFSAVYRQDSISAPGWSKEYYWLALVKSKVLCKFNPSYNL